MVRNGLLLRGQRALYVLHCDYSVNWGAEKNIQGCNYGSFQIEICLNRKSGYSTQVRVNDMRIFIGNQTTTIPICTERYDDTFNKIAITEKYNRFKVTVLLKPETKRKSLII